MAIWEIQDKGVQVTGIWAYILTGAMERERIDVTRSAIRHSDIDYLTMSDVGLASS